MVRGGVTATGRRRIRGMHPRQGTSATFARSRNALHSFLRDADHTEGSRAVLRTLHAHRRPAPRLPCASPASLHLSALDSTSSLQLEASHNVRCALPSSSNVPPLPLPNPVRVRVGNGSALSPLYRPQCADIHPLGAWQTEADNNSAFVDGLKSARPLSSPSQHQVYCGAL